MSPQILEDRFEIEECLSHTDFMTVYLARDRHYLHRPNCIVKSINYRQANMRHRIEREVQTLELLGSHPQIPNVLAYFHTRHNNSRDSGQAKSKASGQKQGQSHSDSEQTFYIVQSWLGGHPLSEEIAVGRPLSESYVSKLLKDVLVPLARAHEQGVVHQNLHPQHLIRRSTDGQIFLTEFGTLLKLARSRLTEAGELTDSVPVSPQPYSAPELLQENPQPASDLYSLGLIAIEALTGLRHQDLSFDPVKGLLWREHVRLGNGPEGAASLSLAEFIDRLVRHDWRDRFKDAQAALSELKTVQHRNQIAQDSRFPTAIAAPGKATAFGHTIGHTTGADSATLATNSATKQAAKGNRNYLPYPLNLAVEGSKTATGQGTRGKLRHQRATSQFSSYGARTAHYGRTPSNPYLAKWAVGSIAALLAVGIGVKTYQWGEYRISRLPQSWSDWAIADTSAAYPAADASELVPLFSGDNSILLQPAAVNAYWQMSAAAKAEGVDLFALSGYRAEPEAMPPATPIDTQDSAAQEADSQNGNRLLPTAGMANGVLDYHTGYALDIGGASETSDRQSSFARTDAYKWLTNYAKEYGFELSSAASPIKRGLLGMEAERPWHWRYVGNEESQKVFSSDR